MMNIINSKMLKKYNKKSKPKNLKLKECDYDGWFAKEEIDDEEKFHNMPPLEGNEEVVKEGLNILSPNKLLTRSPILSAQIKAGNNSDKLKVGIRQILDLLYQDNKITKNVYNNLIKPLKS